MRIGSARNAGDGVLRLPLPTIAVGNLSVGGTGKTPLAAWIAAYCARRGWKPGILLRGYGDDEPLVHRRLVPEAVVVANPDRVAGGGPGGGGGGRRGGGGGAPPPPGGGRGARHALGGGAGGGGAARPP